MSPSPTGTAVDVPADSPLSALHNVDVFSSMKERDLPSQLSGEDLPSQLSGGDLPSQLRGGDLDGDPYNIIYDNTFCSRGRVIRHRRRYSSRKPAESPA